MIKGKASGLSDPIVIPTMSYPGTYPGAFGIGKVHIKYVKRKQIKTRFGITAFILGLFLICWTKAWSSMHTRQHYLLPVIRTVASISISLYYLIYPHHDLLVIYTNSIKQNATITRDKFGISYIVAGSLDDLLFTQGYVHATDRLFQMDYLRNKAMGTLESLLGPIAIESDIFIKQLNLVAVARRDEGLLSQDGASMLKAYSEGINSLLSNFTKPFEYRVIGGSNSSLLIKPWKPLHTLAIIRLFAWENSHGFEDELLDYLMEVLGSGHVTHQSAFELLQFSVASNTASVLPSSSGSAWVVGSDKLGTRRNPILESNIHSVVEDQLNMYINSLEYSDNKVAGLSIPGIPFVLSGHNEHVAWGFTFSAKKSESLHVNRQLDDKCIKDSGRGECSAEFVSLIHDVTDTINPALRNAFKIKSNKYMMQHDLWQYPFDISLMRDLNYAKNANEFTNAVTKLSSLPLQFIYADINDQIGFASPTWDKNPLFKANPISGYIVLDDNFVTPSVKSYGSKSYIEYTLLQKLGSEEKLDLSALVSVDSDLFSVGSMKINDIIMSIKAPKDKEQKNIVTLIKNLVTNFDGYYMPDESAPVFIEVFKLKLFEIVCSYLNVYKDTIPILSGLRSLGSSNKLRMKYRVQLDWIVDLFLHDDDDVFKDFGGSQSIALEALMIAYKECTATFGKKASQWKWGKSHLALFEVPGMHKHILKSLFNIGPNESPGSSDSIFRNGYNSEGLTETAKGVSLFTTTNSRVSSHRIIVDLQDWDSAKVSTMISQSTMIGKRWSEYIWQNPLELWIQGSYLQLCWTQKCIKANTVSHVTLRPGK